MPLCRRNSAGIAFLHGGDGGVQVGDHLAEIGGKLAEYLALPGIARQAADHFAIGGVREEFLALCLQLLHRSGVLKFGPDPAVCFAATA